MLDRPKGLLSLSGFHSNGWGFRSGQPMRWVEEPDSTVHIAETAREDIRAVLRKRFGQVRSR